jgi:CRISPR-associated protein Cas1
MRFPDEDVSELTMQQLRGREGTRVRRIYREHAERTGVEWTGRNYDRANFDTGDPINQALSAANAALYGIVHSVIVALGCSPALGFVHTGHHRSFVYDIADLYKAELTIPVAFDIAAGTAPDVTGETRRRLRDTLHNGKLLQRCARDIGQLLLADEVGDPDIYEYFAIDSIAALWDERHDVVPGGVGYGSKP